MAGKFFSKLFSSSVKSDELAQRHLLELKDISESESVQTSIQTHLMGLGVMPDTILEVQRCIELSKTFSSASGAPADEILQLAAQGDLDQVIQHIEENGTSGVARWLQENGDLEEDDDDLEDIDHEYLKSRAREILEKTFQVAPECWLLVPRYDKQIDLLFFYELYEIRLSSELLTKHPEAEQYLHRYPSDFVDMKFQEANSNVEFASYRDTFHTLLATFPADQRLYVHRMALYGMHCQLLFKDFGEYWNHSVTKEAEEFLQAGGA